MPDTTEIIAVGIDFRRLRNGDSEVRTKGKMRSDPLRRNWLWRGVLFDQPFDFGIDRAGTLFPQIVGQARNSDIKLLATPRPAGQPLLLPLHTYIPIVVRR